MIATLPWTGASLRTITGGSKMTRTRSPWAAAVPASASCSTVSGLLISFFIEAALVSAWVIDQSPRSAGPGVVVDEAADYAADERPDDRDPCVSPVRRPLARDRQDRVHDPRPEVARRVDRVSGGSAERQPDAQHEQSDEQNAESATPRHEPHALVGEDAEDPDDEDGRADDLGDQVRHRVADRRTGREDRELQPRILGCGEVLVIRGE